MMLCSTTALTLFNCHLTATRITDDGAARVSPRDAIAIVV
jgi:hypothetical protein